MVPCEAEEVVSPDWLPAWDYWYCWAEFRAAVAAAAVQVAEEDRIRIRDWAVRTDWGP